MLVYALVDATDAGWGSTQTIGLLGLSAALIAAFVAIELRSQAPLMPFRIFRIRTLTGANVVGLLVGASLFSMFFFISLYMQQVLGYSAIKAGLSYLPLALTIIVSAGIASQLVTRIGFKPVLVAGMAVHRRRRCSGSRRSRSAAASSPTSSGPSLLAAVGLGFAFVTMTIAAVSGRRASSESGLASGLINTSQQIGGALGLAVLATIANSRTDDVMASAGGDPSALPNALTEGFQAAFLGGAVIAAARLRADAGADPRPRQPRPRRAQHAAVRPPPGRARGDARAVSRRQRADDSARGRTSDREDRALASTVPAHQRHACECECRQPEQSRDEDREIGLAASPATCRGGQGRGGWSDRLQARGVVPGWVPRGPGLRDAVEQRCGSCGGSFGSSAGCLVAAVAPAMSGPATLRRVPLPLDRVSLACMTLAGSRSTGAWPPARAWAGPGSRPRPVCESVPVPRQAVAGPRAMRPAGPQAGPLASSAWSQVHELALHGRLLLAGPA